jgi:peptide-methionine (S)-S-oxide reductase
MASRADEQGTETATFGGGCFWGVEETFRTIRGVQKTTAGYMGGTTPDPTYEMVCTGRTGHAEAVQVEFDPNQIDYQALLAIFFSHHDPTSLNRQGPDVGEQYRSVIFFHSPRQEEKARQIIRDLDQSGRFRNPIQTAVVQATRFYPAEKYHQQYLVKHGRSGCHR